MVAPLTESNKLLLVAADLDLIQTKSGLNEIAPVLLPLLTIDCVAPVPVYVDAAITVAPLLIVGVEPNTKAPEPVSSVTAEDKLALVGVAKNVDTLVPKPVTLPKGSPVQLVNVPAEGVPKLGVSEFSEGLADRVSTIELNSIVQSVKNGRVKGNFGIQNFDAVIVATDAATATSLTGIMDYEKILPSTTWYHATRAEIKDSKYLNIDQNSKLVNSVVISEVSSQYAPKGYSLIASTALSTLKETEVKKDLAQIWGTSTKLWELVARYDIKNSLPLRKSPHISGTKISDKLYVAGDYLDLPSQNGAMRSGRRAALEVIKDLNLH